MSGKDPCAAVVGWPVTHSLSPVIHRLWLEAAGVRGCYGKREVQPGTFVEAIADLRSKGLRGVNVTVPHKEAALALADRVDAAAKNAGAANLLLFTQSGVEGRNTDGIGMLAALGEQAPGFRPQGCIAVVLGAGGAARGAAAALRAAGAAELRIVNRTRDRAETLAEDFGGRACGWEDIGGALAGATLVLNATTRGLNGVDPLALDWPAPPPGAAALDMVYKPLETAFLAGARAAGWACADGLAMLIGQARPSFEAFFGAPPPAQVDVRAACLAALEGRG